MELSYRIKFYLRSLKEQHQIMMKIFIVSTISKLKIDENVCKNHGYCSIEISFYIEIMLYRNA